MSLPLVPLGLSGLEPRQDLGVSNVVSLPMTSSSSALQVWREIMQPVIMQHYQDFSSRSFVSLRCNWYWVKLSLIVQQDIGSVGLDIRCVLSDNFTGRVLEDIKQSASNMLAVAHSLSPHQSHNLGANGSPIAAFQLAQLFAAFLLLLQQQIEYKLALLALELYVGHARDIEKWDERVKLTKLQEFLECVFVKIVEKYRYLQGKPTGPLAASFSINSIVESDKVIRGILTQALSSGELLTRQSIEAVIEQNPHIINQVGRGRKVHLVPSCSGIPYKLQFGGYNFSNDVEEVNILPLVSFMPNYREMLKDLVVNHICSRCI
ncbi:hypothetical protein CLAVI_000294 [Candidatus Clavichlamydia salmonicola]|uniref:hypothetical protein n=1 Tax=Candidatus Clavichlamydia salmonicola TaxID=469812 RepID=UPI001890FFE3|nr:hypothetical protein [Candidatus Clavichlamydia salmonicola]MBF5050679.1 hypothetical protein [Candidatus Clavichlamydia salmonicola]